jgi:small subunit ribosomal protein S4
MSSTTKKYKICRRLGVGMFEKCQTQKFLARAKTGKKEVRVRRSDYGVQFLEKQKIRFTYGVREKQFSNYINFAMTHGKKDIKPSDLLSQLLERRLDNVVYRLGLANSRALARQIVSHGHILVNGKKLNIPSYQVEKGDIIAIREGSKKTVLFTDVATKLKAFKTPDWIKWSTDFSKADITAMPKGTDPFLNPQSVIEFYSR